MRTLLCAAAVIIVSAAAGNCLAGTYGFHPSSVLKLGGTFDPQHLDVAYPSCIIYDREYAIHRLGRKEETAPAPSPRSTNAQRPAVQPGGGSAANPPAPGQPAASVKDEPQAPPADARNISADNSLSIEQIKTREQYYSFLHVSTAISGHYGLFSASGNLDYESEQSFDSESFVFGVRGYTTFGEVGLINPVLSDDAKSLSSNLSAFYTRCGREWVSTETRGVLIAVIYTIKNVSQSQRSKLEAAISGGFSGAVAGFDVKAQMEQIFKQAFVSNYYSAKIHAVGGRGVSAFASTITQLDKPEEVIKQIKDYMITLTYDASVPVTFTTGSLDQFLAQDGHLLIFEPFNRRIAELFLAYDEYRGRRNSIWRFLNDDGQSVWGSSIDDRAWVRFKALNEAIGKIEAKAQLCKVAADGAAQIWNRRGAAGKPPAGPRGVAAPSISSGERDFLRDFSAGSSPDIAARGSKTLASVVKAKPGTSECDSQSQDEVGKAREALCLCLKTDDDGYLQSRFVIDSTPTVTVIHDVAAFAPRSLIYLSVNSPGRLTSVTVVDNAGKEQLVLKGGVDPQGGPVWYGSLLYRNGSGQPPDPTTLPYTLQIKDDLGRLYSKPIVVTN